jgi:hypothetical protein
MSMYDNDSSTQRDKGVPVIRKLSEIIKTGERRLVFLEDELQKPIDKRKKNPKARDYMRSEIKFIKAAIAALNHHRLALYPETSPYAAIQQVVAVVDEYGFNGSSPANMDLHKAVNRARRAVYEATPCQD